MEPSSCPEWLPSNRIKAIQELTKSQIIIDKLREMQGQLEKTESDLESDNGVVVQVLGMFENTLSILSSSNPNETPYNPANDVRSPNNKDDQKPTDSDESINTITSVKTKRGCHKRRKNSSTTIEITPYLTDDGYAWRKYGQKTILNSKHQRNYYRCSHKLEQGCQATKQVQKTDDEPSKYKITLSGFHTCNNFKRAPQIILEPLSPRENSNLISFKTNTLVENNKVSTCFQSMRHTPKEGFSSLGPLKHKQVSSSDHHTSWDPIVGLSQVQSKPMSLVSSELDCPDMVLPGVFSPTCSTYDYEIEDMIESYDNIVIGSSNYVSS